MNHKKAGRFDQIKTYTGQCFRISKNEKQWKFLLSTLLLMIIVAAVTVNDDKGMFRTFARTQNDLFVVMCGCVWVGIFNSIQSVCREREIIKKEKQTGLHISSYVMAHVNYEFVLCLAEAFIVTIVLVIDSRGHLPEEGIIVNPILEMFISFFLVIFAADMLALLISCIVRTPSVAMTVMPFALIIQLVFADVVINLKGDVLKTIANLTVVKWGMQALQVIAASYKGVRDSAIDLTEKPDFNPATNIITYPPMDLKGMHLLPELNNLLEAWGMLILFVVVYILLAVIALRQVSRDKR